MYTKQEAARLRQAFWTAFGQYKALVPMSGEEKSNWLNFKTGIRHLYFKMEAERNEASVAIVLEHPDAEQQQAHYEQLRLSKAMLEAHTGETWQWEAPAPDEQGKMSSRVYCRLDGVNVFNQGDWPAIISFLKPRLVALETWWQEAKYGFEF